MIDSSEKRNRRLGSELQKSHVCEKRSKVSVQSVRPPGSGGINEQLTVCFSILLVFIQYNISV